MISKKEAINTSIELIENNQTECASYIMDYGFNTQLWALRNYNKVGVDEFYDETLEEYEAWFFSFRLEHGCNTLESRNCEHIIEDMKNVRELLYPKSDLEEIEKY